MIPNFLRTSAVVFVSSAALALSAAAPSSALTTFSGSLGLPDPTWVRPVPADVNDGNAATNGLANGTSYYYDIQPFTVVSGGPYRILVNSTSALNPLVVLYQGHSTRIANILMCFVLMAIWAAQLKQGSPVYR